MDIHQIDVCVSNYFILVIGMGKNMSFFFVDLVLLGLEASASSNTSSWV